MGSHVPDHLVVAVIDRIRKSVDVIRPQVIEPGDDPDVPTVRGRLKYHSGQNDSVIANEFKIPSSSVAGLRHRILGDIKWPVEKAADPSHPVVPVAVRVDNRFNAIDTQLTDMRTLLVAILDHITKPIEG
jgi:hypothetical protein